MDIIGADADIDFAIHAFNFLRQTFFRCWNEFKRTHANPDKASYYRVLRDGLNTELKAAKQRAEQSYAAGQCQAYALVVVDQEAVITRYVEDLRHEEWWIVGCRDTPKRTVRGEMWLPAQRWRVGRAGLTVWGGCGRLWFLKASLIIPPALAFVVVVVWNSSLWRLNASREEDNRIQRGRIAAARPAGASGSKSSAGGGSSKVRNPVGKESLDWKSLAAKLGDAQQGDGGVDSMREMVELQKRMSGMSKEEIIAALDEIAALGLDPESRRMLEEMLIGPLIEKDPELALTTYANRIKNDPDGIAGQLSPALAAWAKKNPAAASAWMDRQIAAGLFDSKTLDGQSPIWTEFEAAMLGVLLTSDVAAAAQRLAALPEEQRRETLEQIPFSELSPAAQKAYAELVRGLVPQDERPGSFTHAISELIPDGGYAKVGAFLDAIGATPEERAVSAREAANVRLEEIASDRAVTREDVDAMREWVNQQAPGTADRVTGEALADAAQEGGDFGFAEASKLVLEYHKKSGNDDMLVAFLESFAARSNLEEALPLVDKISDPKLREKILEGLK